MLQSNQLLVGIPESLRSELVECYKAIAKNFYEGRWEPSELNGGKFCEIVYSIIEGALQGNFPDHASKPANMVAACKALEGVPSNADRVGDRSLRVLLPRLLPFIYEVRNNRGVGHVGGDVVPNREDAEAVLSLTTWATAELVRIFHGVSLADAQVAVDMLVERRHPLVWSVRKVRRVLDSSMPKIEQTLLLLYTSPGWVGVDELCAWVEYSSRRDFIGKVLKPMHTKRLIEYSAGDLTAIITPKGAEKVEAIESVKIRRLQ